MPDTSTTQLVLRVTMYADEITASARVLTAKEPTKVPYNNVTKALLKDKEYSVVAKVTPLQVTLEYVISEDAANMLIALNNETSELQKAFAGTAEIT